MDILRDLRHAFRTLAGHPGYTAAAVLTPEHGRLFTAEEYAEPADRARAPGGREGARQAWCRCIDRLGRVPGVT